MLQGPHSQTRLRWMTYYDVKTAYKLHTIQHLLNMDKNESILNQGPMLGTQVTTHGHNIIIDIIIIIVVLPFMLVGVSFIQCSTEFSCSSWHCHLLTHLLLRDLLLYTWYSTFTVVILHTHNLNVPRSMLLYRIWAFFWGVGGHSVGIVHMSYDKAFIEFCVKCNVFRSH